MFYKLLGYVVWNGGKVFLRTRYGSTYMPKSVLAAVAVGGLALALLVVKRNGTSD